MKKKRRIPAYTPNDKYFYRAKEAGYRARSAFKLLEIQEHFRLIRKEDVVLDIGAAPGSFMQVVGSIVGDRGLVIGMDLQEIEAFREENMKTFVCDVFDHDAVHTILKSVGAHHVDVIISDIAPKTSGMADVDQWHSVELNLEILKISDRFLKPKGSLLLKVFQGEDFPELLEAVRKRFDRVKVFKPKASRERSVEVYVVASDLKKNAKVV